ncbi:MAG: glycine cleavage system aminomethyltransferase GcvT [Flavobacteriales bacterium]|nr:glycine cleavage system aminomethyltransferase GcvT [Flavobacteriales bacterium]
MEHNTDVELKKTALNSLHYSLGAKMVPFAGWDMPVQYTGVNVEHETVRHGVGVFDCSHMGEFFISGKGALPLIQKVCSNDASKLYDGKIQYSCLPNGRGGIVDDLLVYRQDEEHYILVVNASNIDKDWEWISSHNDTGAVMENRSDALSLLAIQGPKAVEALQSLTDVELGKMEYYTFTTGRFAGYDDIIISATGYTGAGGFEIYFPNEIAEDMWKKVFEAGAAYGIAPIGLGARDTLRLEKGFCLYGNDIDDTTSPIEAGLGWITKFTKEFTDCEILKEQKEKGVSRKLVGLVLVDKGVARHGYPITDENGIEIGQVTSGTMSPSLKKAIAMAYVPTEKSSVGSIVYVKVREKLLKAEVVKMPFL